MKTFTLTIENGALPKVIEVKAETLNDAWVNAGFNPGTMLIKMITWSVK